MTQNFNSNPRPIPIMDYCQFVENQSTSGSFRLHSRATNLMHLAPFSPPLSGPQDFVVMSGWLCKQGLKSGSWQDRFFLLSRTQIQYKKTSTEAQPQGRPTLYSSWYSSCSCRPGVIPLSAVVDVVIYNQGDGSIAVAQTCSALPPYSLLESLHQTLVTKDNCLGIVTSNRVFYAYADNTPVIKAWQEAILYRVQVLPHLNQKYPQLHAPSERIADRCNSSFVIDQTLEMLILSRVKKKGLFSRPGLKKVRTLR